MNNIELTFHPLTQDEKNQANVYIQELKDFKLDGDKGEFTFNGYYYVQFPNEDEDEVDIQYVRRPSEKLVMFV